MDSHSTGLIIALIVLIVLSAYFSATETAFSSLNRIRLKNLADNGNKRAKLAYKLVDNYDELISSVLVGNNIVNISASSLATVLFIKAFGDNGPTVSTIAMTIIVLIFGEVTPKSIAKERPRKRSLCFPRPSLTCSFTSSSPLTYVLWASKSW
ncbi:CNNM domain-containing protein [Hominenteromicrobium sp.]|uniref:CNNM domain-containing protein n=1 Tax=Hominenteromicrobium sp. TaxID=3073581 RepID=UPI00399A7DD3